MGSRTSKILFWGIILAFGLHPVAFGQLEDLPPEEDPTASTTTRVTIGEVSGVPGETLTMPVYFTPAQGTQVGLLKLEVNFVSANLKFVRLDRGIVAELGNLDLSTDVKTSKNEKDVETTSLKMAASLPHAESAKEGISRGLLAFLILRITEEGRPASITLRMSGEATELKTNKPIQNFEALNAKVEVFAPGDRPTVSCFFFSH